MSSGMSTVVGQMKGYAKLLKKTGETDSRESLALDLFDYAEMVEYERKRIYSDILMLSADCMAKGAEGPKIFQDEIEKICRKELYGEEDETNEKAK